ncbi:LacI family DNA-binding transcriptional regulator [soil metagenome]
MRRVTLRDVAPIAQVPPATISNALNRPEMLTRKTLQRVQAAIAQTGYVSDETAKLLRVGVSKSIGVIVSDSGNPFFAELLHGIEDAAAAQGLFVLHANSNGSLIRETDYVKFMESQRVRGLILAPSGGVPDAVREMAERGTPFVVLGEARDDAAFPTVSGDDTRGGMMAARHLLEAGRRRIAFVGGPLSVPQLANRLTGARAAMLEFPGARFEVIETESHTVAAGVRAGELILDRKPEDRPDAIQAGNDLLAIGLAQTLARDPAVRIPQDISIIGYDDVPFAASAIVPLSTVRHPGQLIGKTALDLLLSELDEPADAHRRHLVFIPELVVRQSTAG